DDQGVARPVDSGFIVFNEIHYPVFTAWLRELGAGWKDSDMSFGVSDARTGLEYNATSLNALFCQRRNLLRPAFLGMVRDILRFYRNAPALLASLSERDDNDTTLGQWLSASGLGEMFAEHHLVPMASALWSAPMSRIRDFPMRHLLAFMDNHGMLQVNGRPIWRTIDGGSRVYVQRAAEGLSRIHTGSVVRTIERQATAVRVSTDDAELQCDAVVLACHSDQALALLSDPDPAEASVLGAIAYQPNEAVLHTDISVLPRHPAARASWNVRRDPEDQDRCRVSYFMNKLQGIDSETPFIVSLNQTERIDPARILVRRNYRHPVFTPEAVAAQARWSEINGRRRTWYCGAWWGWGFHEDGARSALRVVEGINSEAVRRVA
ncbi:MAG: FAD-dependent oxidoreductase, partial [Wenzhouxiangella sp.]|nr:FAD-dependent oxidoreductase [Wenzhouxiangella sp.]